jgi:hypothetical protein
MQTMELPNKYKVEVLENSCCSANDFAETHTTVVLDLCMLKVSQPFFEYKHL